MDISLSDRFWSKVDNAGDLGRCWNWKTGLDGKGYGRFSIDGREYRAHRLVYSWFVDDAIDGWHVCHHCDNPRCVNPLHLFKGTHSDNMQDMWNKGRAPLQNEAVREKAIAGMQEHKRENPEWQNRRLSVEAICYIVSPESAHLGNPELGDRYGTLSRYIWDIRSGRKCKAIVRKYCPQFLPENEGE